MPSFSSDPFTYLRRRALGRIGGGGSVVAAAYDPDAVTYFNAMTVQASDTRKGLINDMIVGLKADGVWSKLDLLYLLASHDSQAALLNAKAPATFTATPTGGTTFTTDRGYTANGSTGYLGTGFNPSTAPTPNWTQPSASLFAWVNAATSNTASTAPVLGSITQATVHLRPWVASQDVSVRINLAVNGLFTGTITSRLGSRAASRTFSLTSAQMNGAAIGTPISFDTVGNTNSELAILRDNTLFNGNDRVPLAAFGGALSGAEMTALHTRSQTFLTAIGAN